MVFKRAATFIAVLSLTLTSCSFNNTTGNPGAALLGGVAGAGGATLLGANHTVAALAGVAGASIGYYVTTLGAAAGGIYKGGGQVFALGDYVTIDLPSDNLFDVNTADLLPEAKPILDSALAVINRYPDSNIMISGNTSGFGPQRYEQRLSQSRARQIAGYFWSQGISPFKNQNLDTRRMVYVGYGDFFPISNNIRAKSIRQNSHIQITLFPSSVVVRSKRYRAFNNMGALDEPPIRTFSDNEPYHGTATSSELSPANGYRPIDYKGEATVYS